MDVSLFVTLGYIIITILFCIANNSWIKKTHYTNLPLKERLPKLWPIYLSWTIWFLFILIDVYVFREYLIKTHYFSSFELIWNILIITGIVICHLHSGLFLYDTLLSLNFDKINKHELKPLKNGPSVSILIPACNELILILKPTLEAAKEQYYSPFEIVLIENSSNTEIKKKAIELANQLNIKVLDMPYLGSKAKVLNLSLQYVNSDFIAILDADQISSPNFISDTIPYLLKNKNLAFVQTPQDYRNGDESIIAKAASGQQYPFYKYILPGRTLKNSAFSVGTNVLYNLKHLKDIGGFDENTVTEDIATSFALHKRKFDTLFLSKLYAIGYGPIDFSSYLIQQKRWANGTICLLKSLFQFKIIFSGLTFSQWLRYTASAMYYLSGPASIIFLFSPILLSSSLNQNQLYNLSQNPAILTLPFRILFYSFLTIITIGNQNYLRKWFWQCGMITITASLAFTMGFFEALFQKRKIFKVTSKIAIKKSLLSKITLTLFILLWICNIVSGSYLISYISLKNEFLVNLVCILLLFWTFINCITTFSVLVFYNEKSCVLPNICITKST